MPSRLCSATPEETKEELLEAKGELRSVVCGICKKQRIFFGQESHPVISGAPVRPLKVCGSLFCAS